MLKLSVTAVSCILSSALHVINPSLFGQLQVVMKQSLIFRSLRVLLFILLLKKLHVAVLAHMIYLSLHESYYMNKYCSFFFIVIDTRYVAHTEMQGTSVKFDPCVRHVHQM